MKTMNTIARLNRINRKRQRGISNIQIMVGVLISAILILGGMGLMRYIDKAKVNNELNELSELKARTVSYGSQHGGNFAGFTQELAIGFDFFPANRVSGAAGSRVIQNQWKGTITVAPTIVNFANDSVLYTSSGVPSGACKDTAMQVGAIAAKIVVGTTTVKAGPTAALDEAALITACDAAADNASLAYSMTK
jgi:hypothetical protein